jgi:hypothetical protein
MDPELRATSLQGAISVASMAILATPTAAAKVGSQPISSETANSLGSAFQSTIQLRNKFGAIVQPVTSNTARIVLPALSNLLYATQLICAYGLLAARILLATSIRAGCSTACAVWDCKTTRQIRKRIEFEFFVLILGPSGNALLLTIFWPGWILILPVLLGLLYCLG